MTGAPAAQPTEAPDAAERWPRLTAERRLAMMRHWAESETFSKFPWIGQLLDEVDALTAEIDRLRVTHAEFSRFVVEATDMRRERDDLALILTRVREKHQERAAGALWNGPHGACSACMLPYPCAVIRALSEAENEA